MLQSLFSADEAASQQTMHSTLRMMVAFVNNALKQRAAGSSQPSDELVKEIQHLALVSPAVNDEQRQQNADNEQRLQLWIEAVAMCISHLTRSDMHLVDALLAMPWMVRSDALVGSYIHFIENLISAQSYFIAPVIKRLVVGFHYRAYTEDVPLNLCFDRVHIALRNVLALIPSGPMVVVGMIADKFPHKSQPLIDQQCYIKNTLRMLTYAPVLREQTIAIIIEKVLEFDVEIQVEVDEVEESTGLMFSLEEERNEQALDVAQKGIALNYDQENAIVFDSDSDDGNELTPATRLSVNALIAKLDHIMQLLLEYIVYATNVATNPENEPADTDLALYDLYHVFANAFEQSILPTYKSRHTQFLIFYLCSLNPTFSDAFLGLLAQKIVNPSTPPVIRVTAALYMASFVARANYLPLSTVKDCFVLLVQWCQAYVDSNETNVSFPDVDKYGVFYAVTQAVLYIFCFRWKALIREEESEHDNDHEGDQNYGGGLGPYGGLHGFERVIMSRFNPLKVLSPPVVNEFARITHLNNILYCYSVIERNKKMHIPMRIPSGIPSSELSQQDHQNTRGQTLDSYFPFDPYKLSMSASFIEPLYTCWGSKEDEDGDTEAVHSENNQNVAGGTLDSRFTDINDEAFALRRRSFSNGSDSDSENVMYNVYRARDI